MNGGPLASQQRLRLFGTINEIGDVTKTYPILASTNFYPLNQSRQVASGTRYSILRLYMASTMFKTTSAAFAGLIVLGKRSLNSAQVQLSILSSALSGMAGDFYLAHAALQTQAGATVNSPDSKVQERIYAPGELILTANDAIGVYTCMANAADTAAGVVMVDYIEI